VIHHVQLACSPGSEDVLRAFYGGVLGLEEIPQLRLVGTNRLPCLDGSSEERVDGLVKAVPIL